MHRLTLTLIAPHNIDYADALQAFAVQLHDIAEDLGELPARNHAFGAFGPLGCKLHYRLEVDEPRGERMTLPAAGL